MKLSKDVNADNATWREFKISFMEGSGFYGKASIKLGRAFISAEIEYGEAIESPDAVLAELKDILTEAYINFNHDSLSK